MSKITIRSPDALVEKAVALVKGYRLGDPLDLGTTLGPMAQASFADTVRAQGRRGCFDGGHGAYPDLRAG